MTVCIDFSFDMDHFHSCDQWLHKLHGTKGIFCMKKEFNSHTIFLGGGIPIWPPFHCSCTSICDFYVPHIAICFPHKIWQKFCF